MESLWWWWFWLVVWHTVGSWDNRIHALGVHNEFVVVGVWGVGLLLPAVLKLMTVVVGGGVVRVVVCQLHSGREHLIWTAAADHLGLFVGLGCGVVVVCRECSHLLIGTSLWGV